jgi:hypothetical protein
LKSGSFPNCYITLNPIQGQTGVTTLDLRVSDGIFMVNRSFILTVFPTPFPTVNLSNFLSLRANWIDCGHGYDSIEYKISHCAGSNNGATVNVGGGKIWKLVTKIGPDEFWMDDATGMIWSPYRGDFDFGSAWENCNNMNMNWVIHPTLNYHILNYGFSNGEAWILPTQEQIQAGIDSGLINFLTSGSSLWSSSVFDIQNPISGISVWEFLDTYPEIFIVFYYFSPSSGFVLGASDGYLGKGVYCLHSTRD